MSIPQLSPAPYRTKVATSNNTPARPMLQFLTHSMSKRLLIFLYYLLEYSILLFWSIDENSTTHTPCRRENIFVRRRWNLRGPVLQFDQSRGLLPLTGGQLAITCCHASKTSWSFELDRTHCSHNEQPQ